MLHIVRFFSAIYEAARWPWWLMGIVVPPSAVTYVATLYESLRPTEIIALLAWMLSTWVVVAYFGFLLIEKTLQYFGI